MKQHAYMLVFDGLADWEPAYALCALSRSGKHQVRTVGFSPDPIHTVGGLKVIPDLTLSEVKPIDAAIFILPGGDRWEQIPDAGSGSGLHDLLHRLHVERVAIAASCGATLELARAGLTRSDRHTSKAKEYLKALRWSPTTRTTASMSVLRQLATITSSPRASPAASSSPAKS